jgi:hypothetical protein
VPPPLAAVKLDLLRPREAWVVAERQYWGLLEFLVQTGIIGG